MQSAGSHSLPVLSTGSTRKAVLISGRAAGDMAESLPEALARTMRGSVRLLLVRMTDSKITEMRKGCIRCEMHP